MTDRIPIIHPEQLAELELADMLEGYYDGFDGDPEPGYNQS